MTKSCPFAVENDATEKVEANDEHHEGQRNHAEPG